MTINVPVGLKSKQLDTDLDLRPVDLIGNPPLAGKFLGRELEGFEWRMLLDAVYRGQVNVNVLGRAYVIATLDLALKFNLIAG